MPSLRNLITASGMCGVTLLAAHAVVAASLSDFTGTWNLTGLKIPAQLTQQKDPQGILRNIPEWDSFHVLTGAVSVLPDGSFSGTVGEPISGTAELGAPGEIVLRFDGPMAPPPITCNASKNADVLTMAGIFDGDSCELSVLLKAPASVSSTELAGEWRITTFRTPASLILQTNSQGQVINILGFDKFATRSGFLNVAADGSFTGELGSPFTGTLIMLGNGRLLARINAGPGSFDRLVVINASKDLMVTSERMEGPEDNYQSLILFQKVPTSIPLASLEGLWRTAELGAPYIQLNRNPAGLVIGLTETQFEAFRDSVLVGDDGWFLIREPEAPGGVLLGSLMPGASGLITATVQTPEETQTLPLRITASRTAMSFGSGDEWGSSFALLTLSPVETGLTRDYGLTTIHINNSVTLVWAANTNAALQASSDLNTWQSLPGTQGKHSYTESITNATKRFYRVRQQAP